jgi:DNA/RNA endonuclease YhcR with UshA esterase domain
MKRTLMAVLLLCSALVWAGSSISANQAKSHVGENATVCGQVAGTHYAMRSRGRPTFINLDQSYPQQIFTIVIWGSDREKFKEPEQIFTGKHICVTGKISLYKGVAETIATEPSQITVQ